MRQGGEAHIVEHVPAVPFGATPEASLAALALTLCVLVRLRKDARTMIGFRPIGPALRWASVPEPLASGLEAAQRLPVDAVMP